MESIGNRVRRVKAEHHEADPFMVITGRTWLVHSVIKRAMGKFGPRSIMI